MFPSSHAKKVSGRLGIEDGVIDVPAQLSAFAEAFGSQIRTPGDIAHRGKTTSEAEFIKI